MWLLFRILGLTTNLVLRLVTSVFFFHSSTRSGHVLKSDQTSDGHGKYITWQIKWLTACQIADVFEQPAESFISCKNLSLTVSLILREMWAFMQEQSPVSLTPAITSSLFTLLKCGRQSSQNIQSAEDEEWMVSTSVMENVFALWNKISYELQRAAYAFHNPALESWDQSWVHAWCCLVTGPTQIQLFPCNWLLPREEFIWSHIRGSASDEI